MGYLGVVPAAAQISVGNADTLTTARDISISGEGTGTASFDGSANADIAITLDANVTDQGNTFNGVNQLVQTDGTGKLPAIDGSQLTNLPSGSSTGSSTAVTTTVDTTNFDGVLSGADTNVKLALETLDDHDHSGVYEPADGTIVKDADIGVNVQAYDANTTTAGNVFNGTSQLVQTDGTGKLPAIDGSQLTNLPSGSSLSEHANFAALPGTGVVGTVYVTTDDEKLFRWTGSAYSEMSLDTDTVYTHPTTDGNKHVPANGTTNDGKVLTATAVAGVYNWTSVGGGSGGGGTSTIADATDTNFTALADNDFVIYDNATSKFINASVEIVGANF